MIDAIKLKENGATDAQISKAKDIRHKLINSRYTEIRLWCKNSLLRIYFDAGYININDKGNIAISCKQEFIMKKIREIIGD